MALSGLIIGAIIDCTRFSLSALSQKSILKRMGYGVELIVWALLGALTFYILFTIKGGEWRLVDPLAQILGIFLYESVFQRYFRFIGRVFVLLIIKPIIAIIKLIKNIIFHTIRLVIRIILIILLPFRKIYNKFLKKHIQKFYAKIRRTFFKKR
ncbi:hypothetical protein M3649_16985 [Ureibacillus chungkukjangi]|nr:spore cortex biosynthesis protein YabQ [Ureibacillus chungkukjangi]MCM3389817.1 hypothetical protein [Ureibacillus chungkukjangi]